MMGLGLRWITNLIQGKKNLLIYLVINPTSKSKYGYYTESINGELLPKKHLVF
jgi:hypothetical protein